MSPGRDGSDTDMEPTASQSQDCEPTPPLQRHGSKNNFYLPSSTNHGHSDGLSGGDAVNLMDSHSMSRNYVTRPSPHCRPRYAKYVFVNCENIDNSVGLCIAVDGNAIETEFYERMLLILV